MYRFLGEAFMAIVLIGFGISTLWYHDLYKKEQDQYVLAQKEIEVLENQIQASEANKPEDLTIQANEFIKLLFDNKEMDTQERKTALLSLVTEKAKGTLTGEHKTAHSENTGDLENMDSGAEIKDSVYNRLSSTEGKVIVTFEHILSVDGNESRTLNEATVKLQYEDNRWRVSEYEIKPLF